MNSIKPLFNLAPELIEVMAALGQRIRLARQHRQLRVEDLAQKAQVSKKTVEAIERGAPGTSLGAYVAVLGCMNLAGELALLADPAIDREGAALTYSTTDRRVRISRKLSNEF